MTPNLKPYIDRWNAIQAEGHAYQEDLGALVADLQRLYEHYPHDLVLRVLYSRVRSAVADLVIPEMEGNHD